MKDTGTSLQTVWDSLTIPVAAKQRRKTQGIDDGKYVDKLSFAIQACGDYDKLVQGLWEHYPNLQPQDKSLPNLDRVHDWVMFYDRLSGRVSETQEYELMAFMNYGIVPWYTHMASAANNAKHVEWPKSDYEVGCIECFGGTSGPRLNLYQAYVTRTANEEVATSLKVLLPPVLRSLFSPTTTMTELIPFVMRIISPPLRPVSDKLQLTSEDLLPTSLSLTAQVNANIVKPAEKALLNRLVELMIPLGLKFWVEKSESGQPMMRLEPYAGLSPSTPSPRGTPADTTLVLSTSLSITTVSERMTSPPRALPSVNWSLKRWVSAAPFRHFWRMWVRADTAVQMDAEIARRRGQADGTEGMGTRESLQGMYGAVKWVSAASPPLSVVARADA